MRRLWLRWKAYWGNYCLKHQCSKTYGRGTMLTFCDKCEDEADQVEKSKRRSFLAKLQRDWDDLR